MIDWDRIAELLEEVGEDGFDEVLGMFFEEVEEALAALPGANAAEMKGGLHFLKGAALNIGMNDVSALCKAAEQTAKSGDIADIDIGAIRAALQASQSELREMLG